MRQPNHDHLPLQRMLWLLLLLLQLAATSPPAQAARTLPTKRDSDGDGYLDGPDAWINAGNTGLLLYGGEDKNGDGKYEPAGADGILGTWDDETDPNNPTSHPSTPRLLALDSDMDGLPDTWEEETGTSAWDADTDDDGVSDGQEVLLYGTDPLQADSDLDGLPDGLELGIGNSPYAAATVPHDYLAIFAPTDNVLAAPAGMVASYAPHAGTLIRTNPWENDSDYDGLTDREEDKNGDGVLDAGETDPGRGLAGVPYNFDPINYSKAVLTKEYPSRVLFPTPPIDRAYRILFFFKDLDDTPHWEAEFCLSKGHGSTYPEILIDPSDQAEAVQEDNDEAAAAGLQYWKIKTSGASISNFDIKIVEPGSQTLIHRYDICVDDVGMYVATHGYWNGQATASAREGEQYYLANYILTQGGGGGGGGVPPIGASMYFDNEKGMFYSSELGQSAADIIESLPEAFEMTVELVKPEYFRAGLFWIHMRTGLLLRGELTFTITYEGINKFTVGFLKNTFGQIEQVTVGTFFHFATRPLEFWLAIINYWRYDLHLEVPEEFLALSYKYIVGDIGNSVLMKTLYGIEKERNWQVVLGNPRHFYFAEMGFTIPESDIDKLPPGIKVLPESQGTESSVARNGFGWGEEGKSSWHVVTPGKKRGLYGNEFRHADAETEAFKEAFFSAAIPKGAAMEGWMQVAVKYGLKDLPVIRKVLAIKRYSDQGPDLICIDEHGLNHRIEIKGGRARLGKSKTITLAIQTEPAWNIANDAKYYYYGGDKKEEAAGILTLEDRHAKIIADLEGFPQQQNYFQAVHDYSKAVETGELKDWMIAKGNWENYGLERDDLDKPMKLLNFFGEEKENADLFFDFIESKDKNLYKSCLRYWGKMKVEVAVHPDRAPTRGEHVDTPNVEKFGELEANTGKFWEKLVARIEKEGMAAEAGAVEVRKFYAVLNKIH